MTEFVAPNFKPFGERYVFIEIPGQDVRSAQRFIWALARAARMLPGVVESVPGLGSLTLLIDRSQTSAAQLERALANVRPHSAEETSVVEIVVRYDGEDLEDVARRTGLSSAEVVDLHAGREYVAYFLGFQPGFAYLGDLDARLVVPRRASPRARVPAGAVAIADGMTAVYPFASPGGWNVLGHTDAVVFDAERGGATIQPGARVRFIAS